jgi:TonB-linked SusC/RagA family outer membrane protein
MKKILTCSDRIALEILPGQTLRIMKIAFFLSILTITQIWAAETYSQKTKLTLKLDDVSISEVLKEIETQSEYFFFYSPNLIEVERRVKIDVENESITNILHQLFGAEVTSAVYDRQILLSPAENQPSLSLFPQERQISGTVTDEKGTALIGVNVSIDGTSTGTITNTSGQYTITVPDDDAVLAFSYIGYEPQKIPVGSKTVIDIIMASSLEKLEEVVIVGYGSVRKRDLTGTISSVTTEITRDLPNTNVLQSLQGRIAGLNVVTPFRPGQDPTILIRGINSLSASNTPLIVVDGIIYNGSLNDISVSDIKQIDVLKDASAAAVYGSRSANGVIIISTKMGTSEKPLFNFNAYSGISGPSRLIPMKDGEGYIQKVLDFRTALGLEANPDNIESYLTNREAENYRLGKTVDWYDKVIKTGITQNYDLSVSGRTENTSYYLSGTYYDQKGIVYNDDFTRATIRTNFKNNITDWFSISLRASFSLLDYSGISAGLNPHFGISPFGSYWKDESQGIYEPLPMEDPYMVHPMLNTYVDNSDITTGIQGILSSELNFPFIEGLKWTLNYANNLRSNKNNIFSDNTLQAYDGQLLNGVASKSSSAEYDWTLDNILNYKRKFLDRHFVDLTLLYSREYLQIESTLAEGNDFFNQRLGYNNLGIANVQQIGSDFQDQNSVAYMARLNYIFDDKYAVTATVRRDGFSGFGTNNKYAVFPSAALAWTISKEDFLQNLKWLSLLKTRISYGVNGNQSVGRYQTLARIATSQYVFDATTVQTTYLESMANSDLGWETTKVINLGLDFGLLNYRIRGNVDIYSSDTYDLLLWRNIPILTGFSGVWTNIGKIHNHGGELVLNTMNIQKKDLEWETGIVFSLNRNRIEKLLGEDLDGDGREDDNLANAWFIGQPVDVIFGYQTDGIYQLDDEDIPSGFFPGDFRLLDTDSDGEITPEDRTILGTTQPNFTLSLANTIRYKNFALYILITSIQGRGKMNHYIGDNIAMHNLNWFFSSWTERFNVVDVPYWTPENPSNEYARINYMANRLHPYIEDRSFIRLQDVSLSYTFDQKALNKIHLNGLRIYLSGKNLFTWTGWTGYDPENGTTIGDFPMLRTVSVGCEFSF